LCNIFLDFLAKTIEKMDNLWYNLIIEKQGKRRLEMEFLEIKAKSDNPTDGEYYNNYTTCED
jgi:hypothetical protein